MTLRAVLAAQETSKGKAWREGQCLALFNFPVLTRAAFAALLANWEYRLVRCDLFRAAIKETRKEREGEEKILRMRQ